MLPLVPMGQKDGRQAVTSGIPHFRYGRGQRNKQRHKYKIITQDNC